MASQIPKRIHVPLFSSKIRKMLTNNDKAGSQGTKGTLKYSLWVFCGCNEITNTVDNIANERKTRKTMMEVYVVNIFL